MISPASHLWLQLHKHYRSHHLPFQGGILDQPHKYVQAMESLGDTFAQIQNERLAEMERERA